MKNGQKGTKGRVSVNAFMQHLKNVDVDVFEEMNETAEQQKESRVESAALGTTLPELSLETIVLTQGRPVLDIKRGAVVLDMAEIESQLWKGRLQKARTLLAPNIPAVGRIELDNHPRGIHWVATGWVLRDDIIVTNRHVADLFGVRDGTRYTFRPGLDGGPMITSIDFLEEFDSDDSSEFPLYEIVHVEDARGPDLAFLRIKPIAGSKLPNPVKPSSTSAKQGDLVAVIGYPARDPYFPQPAEMDRIFNSRYDKKRLAPGMITKVGAMGIEHDCTTLGGASGAQIVSLKNGEAVALHFAGTIFKANHAVPIDVVVNRLDGLLRTKPKSPALVVDSQNQIEKPSQPTVATDRTIEVVIPVKIRVEIGNQTATYHVDTTTVDRKGSPSSAIDTGDSDLFAATESKPDDYLDRRGYDDGFLGDDFKVPLPKIIERKDDVLSFMFRNKRQTILNYEHFSVQMSKSRRMCLYSACNIDGKRSKKKVRTGWCFDPRIAKESQIIKECYGNLPKFSRGHMTRREDPVWGIDSEATRGNSDSMHVTNTVPQLQPFNAGIWLRLEDYALQNARKDQMRISVFTGPFLETNDPIRFDIKVPVSFWKIIAFIHDETDELCATGYTMSQKSFLREEEFVFGQHENHQRPIAEIERRSGLSFGNLTELDPLRNQTESATQPLTVESEIRFYDK